MSYRPKPFGRYRPSFRLGAMRQRINIQEATDSVDNHGQPIRSWSNKYQSQPAEYIPLIGTETIRGRQIDATVSAVFTVHYRPNITSKMRVVYANENYGIVRVRPIEGGRRYLELECKADDGDTD